MTTLAATPVAAFTTCPAPWGMLHVAATGAGIVAVDLGSETPDFVDGLARRLHGRVLPAEDGEVPAEWRSTMDAAARQIGEWFAGRRTRFEMPIDLRVSDWDRLVLTGAARLHFGETVGYGELARRIGRPGAAQAVGGAMSRNPVPISDSLPSSHRRRRHARRLRRLDIRRPPGRPGHQAPVARPRRSPARVRARPRHRADATT